MGSRKMRMRVKLGKVETEKRRKKRKEITGKRETGRRLKTEGGRQGHWET